MTSAAERQRASGWLLVAALLYAWEMVGAQLGFVLELRFFLDAATILCLWLGVRQAYGVLHPFAIYIFFSSIYIMSPFVEVALLGNQLRLDSVRIALIADMGTGFMLAATVGLLLLGRAPRAHERMPGVGGQPGLVLGLCGALLTVYWVLVVQRYGLNIGGISRAEQYAEEFTALTFLRSALVALLGCAAAAVASEASDLPTHRRSSFRWLMFILALYCVGDLLILGDRRLVMMIVVGLVAVLKVKPISATQIAIGVMSLVVLTFYGFVRNHPISEWATILGGVDGVRGLNPAANEFGVMAIIGGSISDLSNLPNDFPTYIHAVPQLLPKVLYPDRPQAPSEWFVWTYFPVLARKGAGFAFSAVIEARANGGVLGIAVVGLLTGMTIGLLSRLRWQHAAIGVPIAIHLFVFSMRMDLTSILRTATIELIAVAAMVVVIEAIRGAAAAKRGAVGRPVAQVT